MKKISTIVLVMIYFFSNAQPDSAIYHQIKKDKRNFDIQYARVFFKNGQVKEEGWEYKKENNRTGGKYWGVQYDEFPIILYRVGEWKEYYQNGKLKVWENIPLDENAGIRNEKHFNSNGELIYEFYFSNAEERDYKLSENGKRRKLKTYKRYEYRNDKLWLEEAYKNGKRDGVWKEYINDGPMITKKYDEGKKVKAIKDRAKFIN